MGVPSDTTLHNLNQAFVYKGWFPLGFIDQFIRKILFIKVEPSTGEINWNVPESSINVQPYLIEAAVPASAVNFARRTVLLRRIGDSALVDYYSQAASGKPNDLLEIQIQAKKVGIIRTLGQQIFQGDGVPPNLTGLSALVATSQQFSLLGSLPTLMDIDRLLHTVRASDGFVGAGADCIVTHERVVRYLCLLLANSSVLTWAVDTTLGVSVPCYRGVPIYIGQISDAGPYPYDIWALKITGPTGIRMVHGVGQASEFGIGVSSIPMQASLSQLGAFVGGFYALMVPEPQSIARIQGVSSILLSAAGIENLPT